MPVSPDRAERRYFIVGGAGFIGSHFVGGLLAAHNNRVTVFDNFSSGRREHLRRHDGDSGLTVIEGDASDLHLLTEAMKGHDTVVHLASNPDIARAMHDPEVDFYQGTLLTSNVVEAMRRAGVGKMLYASGSGVYGNRGEESLSEDAVPLVPVSTYGASKLAGEALIASYCAMFGMQACVFRFGNVVGARQTHGVGFDFLRRLKADPTRLRILGDGQQSKPYVHVSDVVDAVLLASEKTAKPFSVFNVATDDSISVNEIARLVLDRMKIQAGGSFYEYTGGTVGWKGDVPRVRLDSTRIRALGWRPRFNSRDAVDLSIQEMLHAG